MVVTVRRAAPDGEAATLHHLWAAGLDADLLPRERFDWILERACRPLAWVCEAGDRPVGCVLVAAEGDQGWLLGLSVEPGHRRHGHGTELLQTALTELAARGCVSVRVGGPGEAYVAPGVDPVAYPAAQALLRHAGFQAIGETFAMAASLIDRTDAADTGAAADPPGVHIAPLAGDRAAVLAMIDAELSPSWAAHLAAAEMDLAGHVLVAHADDGAPIGFAAFDVFPGCPGRFGPTGVAPGARGRGVGGALLRRALAAMRRRGDRDAWFLWGPEGAAGVAMYRTAGFAVTRRFTLTARALGGGPAADHPTGGT